MTGKFRPGIAFTICTNEFHLPKNGLGGRFELTVRKHKGLFPLNKNSGLKFRKFHVEVKSHYSLLTDISPKLQQCNYGTAS